MHIYKVKNYDDMSRKAANVISAQIIQKGDSVLGLATGSTPIGTYQKLIEWYKKGDLDFSQVTTINLDEYYGIDPTNDQSYRYFMNQNLFDHININREQIFIPNGLEKEEETECARYDAVIAGCGGIDLQLLGIGQNGHIGFNEPSAIFKAMTHCVTLSDNTIEVNQRFFEKIEDVPRKAYTMGIKAIVQAEKILVLVSGAEKAEIVRKAFQGSISPDVPASILQLHKNVILIGDDAALSLL